jgi:hypothetical protein
MPDPFDLCQRDGVGPVMGLFAVTIDAPDAVALARFYAHLLGMEVTYEGPEGALMAGDGKSVLFQQVSGYNPPRWPDPAHPQQAHLDSDNGLERFITATRWQNFLVPPRRQRAFPLVELP